MTDVVTFDDVVGFSAFGAEFFGLGSTSFFFQKKKRRRRRGGTKSDSKPPLSLPSPSNSKKRSPLRVSSSTFAFDLSLFPPLERENTAARVSRCGGGRNSSSLGAAAACAKSSVEERKKAREKKTGSAKKKREIQFCRCSHKFLSPPLHSSSSSSTSSTPPKTHSQWPSPRKPSSRRSSR